MYVGENNYFCEDSSCCSIGIRKNLKNSRFDSHMVFIIRIGFEVEDLILTHLYFLPLDFFCKVQTFYKKKNGAMPARHPSSSHTRTTPRQHYLVTAKLPWKANWQIVKYIFNCDLEDRCLYGKAVWRHKLGYHQFLKIKIERTVRPSLSNFNWDIETQGAKHAVKVIDHSNPSELTSYDEGTTSE